MPVLPYKKSIVATFATFAAVAAPHAAHSQPYSLSPEDKAMIEAEVSAKLLDPTSGIYSNYIASSNAAEPGMIWVCGKVRGKNTLGGYVAEGSTFLGALARTNNGSITFALIGIADATLDSETRYLQLCLDKMNAGAK